MSMDQNWQRWIHASLATYYQDYFKTRSIALLIEGQDSPITGKEDWVEMRWDGPYATLASSSCWILDIEINVLASSILGRADAHHHKRLVGQIQASFLKAFPVFKYGENPDVDDQSLLGCLQLRSGDREAIVTSYFGKIETDVVLEQSTIEGHYRMNLVKPGD
jgi:hypothetical protein